MARKPRYQGTTKQRGLGWEHQKARTAALAALTPGTPCPACGQPMYPHLQHLDYDHILPRILGGIGGPGRIMHRSCNRSRGAVLGNKLRGRGRRRPITATRW